ncbi:MAG: DNA polymerase III subunit delta' [Proteobacteria bacterium]|nr:DNA polymerase III subunit delta' [Pseudomonadota bacterium]
MSLAEITPPRQTTGLIGHDAAETRLLEAWNSGRMPHAWLFTGPRGIGKATLAFRLARFALHNSAAGAAEDSGPGLFGEAELGPVTEGLAVDPTLPAARLVANGGHPDLLVIERSINQKTKTLRRDIVVEDVATLSSFLRLTPAGGGWRVVIVDSVDEMNRNAANAMLKLLEEPPKRALLILVSHAPGGLLPTIRSRCRKLHLAPLPDPDVGALLNLFEPNLDPDLASMATRLAEGSIGRALEIAANQGPTVLRDAVRLLDGAPPVDRKRLHEACEIWLRRGKGEDGDPLPKRMNLLLWWLGQGVRRLAAGQSTATETIPGEAKIFNALVGRFGLAGCCERLEQAENTLRRGTGLNLDRKQMVMSMMRELAG